MSFLEKLKNLFKGEKQTPSRSEVANVHLSQDSADMAFGKMTEEYKKFENAEKSTEPVNQEIADITEMADPVQSGAVGKKYFYDYEDYESGEKNAESMGKEITEDPELPGLKEVIVGCWGECYENNAQPILDAIISHKDRFSQVKSLFIGDMTSEECEVSWIEQGDYSNLWSALPNLQHITIQGSTGLSLGAIDHENLQSLTIICGGLPKEVIGQIAKAKLPSLEKLSLYIGVEDYGFDGDIEDVKALLESLKAFPKLTYLGLEDSEIQDEIVKAVVESGIVSRLEELSLANGTLSDAGGQVLLDAGEQLSHLKKLDLHYHFLSDHMMKQLQGLGIAIDLKEQEEDDEEYGNDPMLTE